MNKLAVTSNKPYREEEYNLDLMTLFDKKNQVVSTTTV